MMTETELPTEKAADGTVSGASRDSANWQAMQTHLARRIRRQWTALQRLRGSESDLGLIPAQLEALADDADSLWQLSERLEREIDAAFATCACRGPLRDGTNQAHGTDRTQGQQTNTKTA